MQLMMQYANGKQFLFLISLALGCVLMYGCLTKVKIEFVTTNDVPETNLNAYDHQDDQDINRIFLDQLNGSKVVTLVLSLEELKKRNGERAVDPLLKENVAADDKRLVQAIRDHFIDPPSKKQPKNSNRIVRTPQAAAVETILNGTVSCILVR